jgi:hypothetical protein
MHPRRRLARTAPAVAVLALIVASLLSITASGQARRVASSGAAAGAGAGSPRTLDGHPDLQGYWTNDTYTPLERPAEAGGKAFFTPEEAAAFLKSRTDRLLNQSKTDIHYDDALWQAETYTKEAHMRTSLITDPSDGKIPALTPAAEKLLAARTAARLGQGPADSAQARTLAERCIAWGNVGPPMVPPTYNANFQIVQARDHVLIRHEMMHDVRIVPLDGRPHPARGVTMLAGDARGHWEGETLVVDTTNFTNHTNFRGSPQNTRQDIFATTTLHVIERFTRVDAGTIRYQFTVEDPSVWTRSWSGEMPLRSFEGPIYEYACHEGNYGLPNILSAARAQEATGGTVDAPTPFNRFAR